MPIDTIVIGQAEGDDVEVTLTRRQAIDMMADEMCLEASDTDVLSVAAHGMKWRNKRIAELESLLLKRGVWPWRRSKR